jgi:hypothetical protein
VTREEARKGKTDCLPGCTTRKRVEGTNHSGRRFSNRKRPMCRSISPCEPQGAWQGTLATLQV